MKYNIEFVNNLVKQINTERCYKLFNYLVSDKSDFTKAPASTRFHHDYEGGLLDHCCQIFKNLLNLKKIPIFYLTDENLTSEIAFILAFGHDLSKINNYVSETKWTKVEGKWESYLGYSYNSEQERIPHELGSVSILQRIMPDIEFPIIQAIAFHHGGFNPATSQDFSEASKSNPLVFALHVSDMLSTIEDSKREQNGQ